MHPQTSASKPMRQRVFDLLFNENNPDGLHATVSRWSTSLILLNMVAMVLETADAFELAYATQLDAFETLSVIVFTLEYLLRWFAAPADPEFAKSRFARLSYVGSRYAIIDLLAILPFTWPALSALICVCSGLCVCCVCSGSLLLCCLRLKASSVTPPA